MRQQKIRISPQFLQSAALKQLALLAGENLPITLGRIAALALLMAATERRRFTADEIEQVTGWAEKRWHALKPTEPYARKIERVGWAFRRGAFFTLRLPIDGARQRGGGVRAAQSARADNGQFLPKDSCVNKTAEQIEPEATVSKGER